jgi:hypothetical protein
LIYDEEDEVPEMYFFTEGTVGIGFSLVANGITKDQKHISKKLPCPQLICDHYVVNDKKSCFIYIAYQKEAKGFALTKKFLHEQIFPEYPQIFEKIKQDCYKKYKKMIFDQVNKERNEKIQMINKQSVYRNIELKEKDKSESMVSYNIVDIKPVDKFDKENKYKILAEKIVHHNLNCNIIEIQHEINKMSDHVKKVMNQCENKLSSIVAMIEGVTPTF